MMFDGANYLWSQRYTPAQGWQGAAALDAAVAYSPDAEVVIESGGRALVFWIALDPDSTPSIWAKRLLPTGWQDAFLFEESNAGGFSRPEATISNSGDMFAVWGTTAVSANPLIWASTTR